MLKRFFEKIKEAIEIPIICVLECSFIAVGLLLFWFIIFGIIYLISLLF